PVASRATWSSPMIVGSISVATSEVFWGANRHGPETFGPSPVAIEAAAIGVRATASGSLAGIPGVLAFAPPTPPCDATASGDSHVPAAAFQCRAKTSKYGALP